MLLSSFAENHGGEPVDECEEFSAYGAKFRSRRSSEKKIHRVSTRGASFS